MESEGACLWVESSNTQIWKERLEEVGNCFSSGIAMCCRSEGRGREERRGEEIEVM